MIKTTFAYFLHPVVFGMQKIFALDLLLSFAFCDIDTMSKFMQIHFFCPFELFEKVPARLPVTKGFFFMLLKAR